MKASEHAEVWEEVTAKLRSMAASNTYTQLGEQLALAAAVARVVALAYQKAGEEK